MSKKISNYKRQSLGQLIRALHKGNPKLMSAEQIVSAKNKNKVVLQVAWKGHATIKAI